MPPVPVMTGQGSARPNANKSTEISLSSLYMHVCILALTSIIVDVEYRFTSVVVAGKTPRHSAARSRSRILTGREVWFKKALWIIKGNKDDA
ncbi:hypothetical protein EJ069_10805 [Mesorhizobium sp. M2A.F.Ca.ET.043.05.1.1]|uniref:hypothetical protein n=1 Tax=Mesorhizobium sp. M2A.F.Ca.ET.043.05.1.1 TaxID=2493671 RepID=UPI000F759246|nr:hypothetical protein [Mesorhizobium sp. M2A.F.Ca.ET.043.05.1.1]AZO15175.1 hypothetical protein EJ069_10805 [Mesorhizobium sp. M2A.F.Ca.ET.043.05.1.1]